MKSPRMVGNWSKLFFIHYIMFTETHWFRAVMLHTDWLTDTVTSWRVQHVSWLACASVASFGVEALCVLTNPRHQTLIYIWSNKNGELAFSRSNTNRSPELSDTAIKRVYMHHFNSIIVPNMIQNTLYSTVFSPNRIEFWTGLREGVYTFRKSDCCPCTDKQIDK